jgi:prolyl-tRNA synthetase
VLFKLNSEESSSFALGATHEEVVTPLGGEVISSYKDLPKSVFQIQTKFRNEPRAKSGLLRGREFRMKDLYSFHANDEDLNIFYEKAQGAYEKIYSTLELDALLTEASGGTFSKFSHEYQVEISSGEDVVYICTNCNLAKNKEVFEEGVKCSSCDGAEFRETKACEVGNIFKLGTKYSEAFKLSFTDETGTKNLVKMGCYGIGTSRLMGVLVEKFGSENSMLWPKTVSPFSVHLLVLDGKDSGARDASETLYEQLNASGVEVLYDDREKAAGEKFADSDLIGIPFRIVISGKTIENNSLEFKNLITGEVSMFPLASISEIISLIQ